MIHALRFSNIIFAQNICHIHWSDKESSNKYSGLELTDHHKQKGCEITKYENEW